MCDEAASEGREMGRRGRQHNLRDGSQYPQAPTSQPEQSVEKHFWDIRHGVSPPHPHCRWNWTFVIPDRQILQRWQAVVTTRLFTFTRVPCTEEGNGDERVRWSFALQRKWKVYWASQLKDGCQMHFVTMKNWLEKKKPKTIFSTSGNYQLLFSSNI